MSIPILIVICGPTAAGKSGLAIALAQRLNGVILSADSRQVYREFDIGTAKPTLAEQQQVPHHLIDICDPTDTLTVADYQAQAQALIAHYHAAAHSPASLVGSRPAGSPTEQSTASSAPPIPLLVGGTGLYIKSVVRGMIIPRVAPQPELRSQLEALGQHQCYALLQQVDAIATTKIHPNDSVRTIRALEVYYVTGHPISAQQGENPPNYPILHIGLDTAEPTNGVDLLTQRIAQRTEQMVEMGFVEEVDRLCRTYGEELPLLNTLGYQEIRQYLRGDMSLATAKELTTLHTRQFAKRQRTWFRADRAIEWFDANSPDLVEQVWQRVQGFMARAQAT